MGITLTGKRVQNTYDSLLKLSSNDNLTATPQLVGDGLGNDSPIYLSETKVGIGVSPSFQFQTSDAAKIGGNLTVGGNLIVEGSTTQVDSTIVQIGDNMIELAKDNVANIKDIGWYGTIVESGTKYVGFYYDASSGITTPTFYLGYGTTEPSNTASWTTKGKIVIGQIDSTGGTFSGQITIPETPTADGHAASKKYVDDQIGGADKARRVTITVKNTETVALSAGTVVHAHPTAPVPSGNLVQIKKADYDTASLMPAIGILNEDLDAAGGTNDEGEAIMFGFINGIDTSGFSAGDELYVGNDGALTNSKPLLTTQLIQKIAVVMKVDSTNGSIEVFGAGRSNDVPNEVDRDLSIAGTLKVDDELQVEADSGYGRIEIGGPSGGYIDLKTPFSDDYDLRIITDTTESQFTGAGTFKINAGNTLTLTLDGSTQDATFASKIGLNGATPAYTIDTSETTVGTLRMVGDNGHAFIRLGAGGGGNNVTLIRVDGESSNHDGETDLGAYGFSLKYLGSLGANENAFALYGDNSTATSQVESFRVKQDGTFHVAQNSTFNGSVTANNQIISEHTSADIPLGLTTANLYIKDDRAIAADVGGSIVFSGKYTGTTYLSGGPYIKGYKLNATDNDYSFGLKFGIRKNGEGISGPVLTLDPDSNATFSNKISTTDGIVEIYKYTDTTTTAGTTLLSLTNNVGTASVAGDLSQQKTFIDFNLLDGNDNEYPQVRIGAEVGQNGNANSQTLEGCGAFLVYTNNATSNGPTPTGLNERFRVDYEGVSTFTNKLIVSGSSGYQDSIKISNGRLQLGPHSSGAGVWFDRSSDDLYWFIGLDDQDGTSLRFYRGGNKITVDLNGNTTVTGDITSNGNIISETTSGNKGIKVITANDAEGFLIFGDAQDNSMGGMAYNNATNSLDIDCNNGVALSFDSSRNATFSNNVTLGSSTSGETQLTLFTQAEADTIINYRESTLNYGFTTMYDATANLFRIKRYDNSATGVTVMSMSRTVSEIYSHADLIPEANSTYDLGSTTKYWANLYVDNITVDDKFNAPVTIQGTSTGLLKLYQDTNADGAAIEFSDVATSQSQKGYLTFRHADSQSQSSGESFHFTGTESDISIVAGDGTQVGKFIASAGSTAETAFSFYDDPDTGMYSGGGNAVGLVAGGSRKLNVNSSGVTINNGNLYVPEYIYHDGDTNTYIRFQTDDIQLAANGALGVDINSSGQVGIGGSANYQALNVDGTIEAGNTSATQGALTLVQRYGGNNNDYIGSISTQYSSGGMILGYGARGKPGSGATSFVSTFDNFSGIRGALRLKNGELRLFSSITAVQTAVNSDLIMSTTFIVTDDGLCGIGVTSPNNTLDIDSSFTNSVHIRGTGTHDLYSYHDSGGVGWATGSGSGYDNLIYMHPSTNSIRLYTNGSQAVHINSGGDMGISTNDPQAKLHVVGSTQFDKASANDPDSTSRTRYPAAHMFTYTSDANGLAVIGGQGGHSGTTLMLGQETGRSSAFKFIKAVSDTNGTVNDEFWVDGVGNGYLETSLGINSGNAHPLNVRSDGSSGSATIVAQFTSATSKRPTLSFSESTATSLQAGMSIEYNGTGSGDTNYLSLNAVDGNSAMRVYSGGTSVQYGPNPIMQIIAESEGESGMEIYDAQDFGQNGKILWSASTNDMTFVFNSNNRFRMYDNGDFHADGDVVAYSTSISDERLKDNVVIIDNALDKVKKLNGVSYIWNKGSRKGKKDLGVIAQEVEKVLPEIVHEKEMSLLDGETYKTVDYEKLTAVLIESVKELSAKVEALENRNCNCNCK